MGTAIVLLIGIALGFAMGYVFRIVYEIRKENLLIRKWNNDSCSVQTGRQWAKDEEMWACGDGWKDF